MKKQYYGHNPFDGASIVGTLDTEQSEAVIVYGSRLRFLLNPDFPQDTRALFEALCNVHTITIDGEPFIPHPTSKEVAS